jgi:hypothetical protein
MLCFENLTEVVEREDDCRLFLGRPRTDRVDVQCVLSKGKVITVFLDDTDRQKTNPAAFVDAGGELR